MINSSMIFKTCTNTTEIHSLLSLALLATIYIWSFQINEDTSAIKTFKWLVKDESLVYVDNRSDHEFRFPVTA